MKKLFKSLKSFCLQCKRVWHVLRKPSRKEYEMVAKVSAIGIVILGLIGFIISFFMGAFVK